jgi:hypothetical protein
MTGFTKVPAKRNYQNEAAGGEYVQFRGLRRYNVNFEIYSFFS